MHDVIQLYQRMIAPLSSNQRDKLYQAEDEGMSPFVIGCAILRAKQEQRLSRERGRGKRLSFNYIWAILEDWMLHGIVTEERFVSYWSAQNNEGNQGGNSYAQRQGGKLARSDFKYSEPEEPPKGFFTFLDE